MLPRITGCEPIEIRIKDTVSKRYYFPELLQMRGKKLAFLLGLCDGVITPSNRPTLGTDNNTCFLNAYVTLVHKGNEEINRLPMRDIPQYFKSGAGTYPNSNPVKIDREIDWPKSYVEFTATTGLNINESIMLYAFYNDKAKQTAIKLPAIAPREKVEEIEVPLNTTELRFLFPDNEKLRNRKVSKIRIPGMSTLLSTPSGYSNFQAGFITLKIAGEDKVHMLPPYFVEKTYCFMNEIMLDDVVIDWPNSYITLPYLNVSANCAAYIKVFFHD